MAKDKTGSIEVNEPEPHHIGDTITFTSEGGKMINVTVYQAGLVGITAEEKPADQPFVIGGTPAAGQAIVVAWLYNKDMTEYTATTSFYAEP